MESDVSSFLNEVLFVIFFEESACNVRAYKELKCFSQRNKHVSPMGGSILKDAFYFTL